VKKAAINATAIITIYDGALRSDALSKQVCVAEQTPE